MEIDKAVGLVAFHQGCANLSFTKSCLGSQGMCTVRTCRPGDMMRKLGRWVGNLVDGSHARMADAF